MRLLLLFSTSTFTVNNLVNLLIASLLFSAVSVHKIYFSLTDFVDLTNAKELTSIYSLFRSQPKNKLPSVLPPYQNSYLVRNGSTSIKIPQELKQTLLLELCCLRGQHSAKLYLCCYCFHRLWSISFAAKYHVIHKQDPNLRKIRGK